MNIFFKLFGLSKVSERLDRIEKQIKSRHDLSPAFLVIKEVEELSMTDEQREIFIEGVRKIADMLLPYKVVFIPKEKKEKLDFKMVSINHKTGKIEQANI